MPEGAPVHWRTTSPTYTGRIALSVFFLGTHHPSWLRRTDVPLFVSRRRLETLKELPRACGIWALDSGGFTELGMHGRWTITVGQYIAEVRRYVDRIGRLQWAASMDWLCEPPLRAKTGLSVEEHQRRTTENYLDLRSRAPDLPWVPVLQGWSIVEYWEHADAYRRAGIDLASLPLVGVGSVCRRQDTAGIAMLMATLQDVGARLHAFGMKVGGLRLSAGYVTSADSMAWSLGARYRPPLPECAGEHLHCNNCLKYALRWRSKILRSLDMDDPDHIEPSAQLRLF